MLAAVERTPDEQSRLAAGRLLVRGVQRVEAADLARADDERLPEGGAERRVGVAVHEVSDDHAAARPGPATVPRRGERHRVRLVRAPEARCRQPDSPVGGDARQ